MTANFCDDTARHPTALGAEYRRAIAFVPELAPIAAADVAADGTAVVVPEPQNAEYGGILVRTPSLTVRFRVGKTTPTKVGHFVTVWQRDATGSSVPYTDGDDVDALCVIVRDEGSIGAFVFPTDVLRDRGIVADAGAASGAGSSGKRGFRVYAPWAATANPQARRTQAWQGQYFHTMDRADEASLRTTGRPTTDNHHQPTDDGLTLTYHANGHTLFSRGRYEGTEPSGYWEWYRIDGTLKRSGHFANGVPVGQWITYDSTGSVYKITDKGAPA